MVKLISRATLSKTVPDVIYPEGFDLKDLLRVTQGATGRVAEFIGTGDFPADWANRQWYEIEAGFAEEPILYEPIYNITVSDSLPEVVNLGVADRSGIVFEEHVEGGEAKFMSVSSGAVYVPIRNWAVMLEYTEELVLYNRLWSLPDIERGVGIAHNARLNDLHLRPILDYSYTAANQTPADTTGASYYERLVNTLGNAISASKADGRRGRYVLLTSGADSYKLRNLLTPTPQTGVSMQPAALVDQIEAVIEYDGWTGMRGLEEVVFPGVAAGKAYLIDVGRGKPNARSLVKQPLTRKIGNADISRFIEMQHRWNVRLGTYISPESIVEEITLPVAPTP